MVGWLLGRRCGELGGVAGGWSHARDFGGCVRALCFALPASALFAVRANEAFDIRAIHLTMASQVALKKQQGDFSAFQKCGQELTGGRATDDISDVQEYAADHCVQDWRH